MKTARMLAILVLGLSVCAAHLAVAGAMGTAFTYQGQLYDNNYPANGRYDFTFALYDANVGGNKLGTDINVADVNVIDGYSTIELDFGSGVFDGNTCWLGIGVRPGYQNDPCEYTMLSPRQKITPTPYALQTRGMFVDDAGNVSIGTGPDSYTKLLLHMNGTNASTTFIDSATSKTVTACGDAKITTAQSKFGGACGSFDGNGDYLSLADSADWDFGSGNFTIDMWIKFNSLTNSPDDAMDLYNQYVDTDNRINIQWYTSGGSRLLYFAAISGGDPKIAFHCTPGFVVNTWHHLAIVRNGITSADWYCFVDGVSKTLTWTNGTTGAGVMPDIAGTLFIGKLSTTEYFNGYIDEYRISKGIARWTSNFTPPSREYKGYGNVGIGKMPGNYALDVNGNVNATAYYGDGSHLTGVTPVGFGAWASKSANTVYQAATDGFVVATAGMYGDSDVFGYTDSSNPPTTLRAAFNVAATVGYGSITMPVKKNDYWEITYNGSSPTIYWLPLGN
jgi:hypothetical protein